MKATGGGRYDAEEPFAYFIAGQNITKTDDILRHSLTAANEVFGTSDASLDELRGRLADPEHKVIFDSGVFWLSNEHAKRHGLSHDEALGIAPAELDDFDRLLDTYRRVVTEHEADLWGYIELDQGGADRKRETRAMLEAEGLRPIPVYHPLIDGWDYFDELAEQYDRICVGNVVQANRTVRWRILHTVWERRRRHGAGGPWLHLLGVTPCRQMLAYGFNSCDSSYYVYSLRYGRKMLQPRTLFGVYGSLSNEYVYARADYGHVTRGREAHARLLCYLGAAETEHMRDWHAETRRVFHVKTPYPDVMAGEPVPAPESAKVPA